MPTPTQLYGGGITTFIKDNMLVLGLIGVIIFAFIMFVKFKSKTPKIISRAEIEKSRRIDELKYNNRVIPEREEYYNYETGKTELSDVKYYSYNYLLNGDNLIGTIQSIGKKNLRVMNDGTEEIKNYYEIVFKPKMFLKFANPFKKEIIVVFDDDIHLFKGRKAVMIDHAVSIDREMGILYTTPHQREIMNMVNEHIYKTDKESNASFYFVESQKRSTIDIDFAHDMAMKEKELQIELARKKGKVTSI
jgi:hypothetical protein